MKVKLVKITEWSRDEQAIAGDASHEGDAAVMRLVADEVQAKLEDFTFEPKSLPFEYEFDIEPDCTEDEVKNRVIDEYIEQFCKYDYVKPTDCEIEWEDTTK